MDFKLGRMMETGEDLPFPMMSVVKEERVDFEEVIFTLSLKLNLLAPQILKLSEYNIIFTIVQEEKKGETSRRGRTRSLTKKSADKVDIKAKLGSAKCKIPFY